MCNKKILMLVAVFGLSFNTYADEVGTQKFYDREILTETLTADDQEALAAAQDADLAAQAAASSANAYADETAEAAEAAEAAAIIARDLANVTPDDANLEDLAVAAETLAENTALEALDAKNIADSLQAKADLTAAALALIVTEFEDTALFVVGLTDEQVFALNRSLNNAVKSGLLVDIDSGDLALIEDGNKLQINAFTQAFEQEARFLLKADKFAAKAEESGDDKFLAIGDRMTSKAEDQKAKFIAKINRFVASPSATVGSVAKAEAKTSAKSAAKDTSKGVAKATAKQAAKAAAKETAKTAAKETAKGVAKAAAKRSARAAAKHS